MPSGYGWYECESCGIVRHIDNLMSGCPQCGETMTPTENLIVGDCREVMRELAAESVDAIVCDPPYGLEFMGKEWDKLAPPKTSANRRDTQDHRELDGPWARRAGHPTWSSNSRRNERCLTCGKWRISSNRCSCQAPKWEYRPREEAPPSSVAMQLWHESWAREAYRVLKPGGHLLAFGGSRTYHRLACAIEDAGFEIRDQLQWLYGSGFPKSLDVSKAMDKAAGAEREAIAPSPNRRASHATQNGVVNKQTSPDSESYMLTAPATDLAQRWQGFGTALKPAHEPIVLARKPLIGTVAANVTEHGTGALNIDACRIGFTSADERRLSSPLAYGSGKRDGLINGEGGFADSDVSIPLGRWPANVILGCCGNDPHDESCAAALLDAQTGTLTSGANPTRRGAPKSRNAYGEFAGQEACEAPRGVDTGGAARFFYCAKSSRAERNAGLDGMPERASGVMQDDSYTWTHDGKGNAINLNTRSANHHPTVKPISLMRWLVRLVTPPGGLVLDPFLGSGSTGCAAMYEGFDFIGVEQDAEYVEIARRRIAHHAALAEKARESGSPQLALFDGEAA